MKRTFVVEVAASHLHLNLGNVLLSGECDTAWHGASKHLVSANGDGVDGLLERHLGGVVDEGHHHGEEGTVAVDVEAVAGETEAMVKSRGERERERERARS